MLKAIIILITVLYISTSPISAQANKINLENDLVIKNNSNEKESLKSNIEKEFKPYDDLKISDKVSAGIITGREENTPKERLGIEPKKKGSEVGVGMSFSF